MQVLAHLVVLTASCISFFAWIDAKYNWQVSKASILAAFQIEIFNIF
jgi:hypothetical protein